MPSECTTLKTTVVDFDVSSATLYFFGATMLEEEFTADARVMLGRGLAPASVTWSGPYPDDPQHVHWTAHVAVSGG